MVTPEVTEAWEFYRDNCPGFKEPMRKQLRKVDSHMAELESENAKLRVELDEWKRVAESKQDIIDHMRDANHENARLRELVRVMAYCMQGFRDCDGCAANGADGAVTAPSGCDWLRERMREMGVVE